MKRLRILYVSDIYEESNVYYSQVHLYVEALRRDADVDLIQFTRIKSSHNPDSGVYFLPPKMFLLFQWMLYCRAYFSAFDFSCYDSIIYRGYTGGMFALATRRVATGQLQCVYDVRADVIDEFQHSDSLSGRFNRLFLGKIKRNLEAQIELMDDVFTVSAKLKQLIAATYGKAASKVHHFSTSVAQVFNPDKALEEKYRADFGVGEDEVVFAYTGSLDYWQNVPEILRAFESYFAAGGAGRLLVVTKALDAANDLIGTHCPTAKGRVICLSSAPADVHKYLQMADVGLLIRDNLALNISASPTKYGEYFNSGLHVIITDIGADYVAHGKGNPQNVTVIKDKVDLSSAMLAIKVRPSKHWEKVNSLEQIIHKQMTLLGTK